MENGTKFSKEQLESIKNELKSASLTENNLDSFLQKHLDTEGSQKVKTVLSDPQKLKDILSSPLAKEIIEKLRKKE